MYYNASQGDTRKWAQGSRQPDLGPAKPAPKAKSASAPARAKSSGKRAKK